MKVVLLTGDDCGVCEEAEEALKELIADGEVEVRNIQHDDEALALWASNELPPAPQLLVVTGRGQIFGQLSVEDLIEQQIAKQEGTPVP